MDIKKTIPIIIICLLFISCSSQSSSICSKNIKTNYDNIDINLSETNSWDENNKHYHQLEIDIENKNTETICDWELENILPEDASISESWNCKLEIDSGKVNIKAEKYNNAILQNTKITLGFIFCTSKDYEMQDVKLINKSLLNDKISPQKPNTTTIKKLQINDINIVDEDNNKVILKGISMHGLNWFPQYINEETIKSAKDTFKINAIRLPLYTEDYNGYCNSENKASLMDLIEKGVSIASKLNMYVIVDWHILNDSNPNKNIDMAKEFFKTISKKFKDNTNILYEICNEPNNDTSWDDVKNYANTIITIIRENTDSIIIVGTTSWCQDVDIASKNPLSNYHNIVYSLHFYAATHKSDIRDKAQFAINNNLPIIVSEFSICDSSGSGNLDIEEANKWMDFIKKNNLSYFMWNLSNKDEISSLLVPSCTKLSSFQDSDLSDAGKWFKNTK